MLLQQQHDKPINQVKTQSSVQPQPAACHCHAANWPTRSTHTPLDSLWRTPLPTHPACSQQRHVHFDAGL